MNNVHPIRAAIAVSVVGATIYMLIARITVLEGWWVAVGAVIAFYFTSTKEN